MAAQRGTFRSTSRGASGGKGAKARREDAAPPPNLQVFVPTIDSLDEIGDWLGTFRERLRAARLDERAGIAAVVQQLEARYQTRRAELA